MEIIITIVILSIIVTFALPNWQKAVQKQEERNVLTQLRNIHTANKVYFAQAGRQYLPDAYVDENDIDDFNNDLRTNIILEGRGFGYTRPTTNTFTASISWNSKTVVVDQEVLSDTNPCCSSDNCRIIEDCP